MRSIRLGNIELSKYQLERIWRENYVHLGNEIVISANLSLIKYDFFFADTKQDVFRLLMTINKRYCVLWMILRMSECESLSSFHHVQL